MKRNNLNRFYKLGLLSMLIAFLGSSCVKSVDGYTDFSGLQPAVLIPEGGLSNFSKQALLFPGTDAVDTSFFHLNYSATNVAPADETITISIDPGAIDAYNATVSDPLDQFVIFPDSIFSFTTTSVTILKGNNYSDPIPLVVYPDKIDPTVNYMLPITIQTAPSGSTISSNFKTIYVHLIGNPIAGAYNWDWTRWNNSTGTGAPTGTSFVGGATLFSPVNGTTVSVPSGYFTQPRYVINFTNTGGVLSNFSVTLDASDVQAMKDLGVTVTSGPNILLIDPIAGIYQFQYTVFNGSASRFLIDKFYK